MKTKIRGLVFVGFAAAIFAASAHAEQTDAQTVTSKQFTEATYEKQATALSVDNDGNIEDAAWIGWNKDQTGIAPDGDAGKQWTKLQGRTYTKITNEKGGHYVEMNSDKITTTGQQITDATSQNGDLTDLPTVNAVKEYVTAAGTGLYQPKSESDDTGVWTSSNHSVAGVGIRTGSGTTADPYVSQWYDLAPGQDGNLLSTASDHIPYARINRDDGAGTNTPGVYVDLDHSRIVVNSAYTGSGYVDGIDLDDLAANGGTLNADGMALVTAGAVYELLDREAVADTTTITASSTNNTVPTSKNVYDFVTNQIANGDFQPKAAALTVDGNQIEGAAWIGWSENQTGTQPAGDVNAKWVKLVGDTYTEIYHDKDSHRVRLVGDKIANAGTDLTDPTNATDLVTVAALNNATGGAGPIPAACKQANVHCAIVSSYDATTQTATAEWTVMAQAQ